MSNNWISDSEEKDSFFKRVKDFEHKHFERVEYFEQHKCSECYHFSDEFISCSADPNKRACICFKDKKEKVEEERIANKHW